LIRSGFLQFFLGLTKMRQGCCHVRFMRLILLSDSIRLTFPLLFSRALLLSYGCEAEGSRKNNHRAVCQYLRVHDRFLLNGIDARHLECQLPTRVGNVRWEAYPKANTTLIRSWSGNWNDRSDIFKFYRAAHGTLAANPHPPGDKPKQTAEKIVPFL